MHFRELCHKAHKIAQDKGWHDYGEVNLERRVMWLALVHAELSEALEELRAGKPFEYVGANGKPEGYAVELADAVIRIMDSAEADGIDLFDVILRKMEYNKSRPHKHGGKLL